MAYPVYSENLVSEILTDTEDEITCPAGVRWVIRTIALADITGGDGEQAFVRTSGIIYLATATWESGTSPPPPAVFLSNGRWVIETGEQINFGSISGTWTFHI